MSGVNRDSILGPLLLNTDLCSLFFITEDSNIANYAANNTLCLSWKNMEELCNLCIVQIYRICRQIFFNGLMKTN